jgi:zinc-ribbon domain
MDAATLLVMIAVLLLVLAYVLQPFFTRGDAAPGRSPRGALEVLRRRAGLLIERNRIYAAIREIDFDYKTNKVSDEDYAAQRHALVAQGVEVLQQIDALPGLDETPSADPIEAAVIALAGGESVPIAAVAPAASRARKKRRPAKTRAGFCPHCGQPVQAGDLFCGSCGNRL